ncbi:MAG: hypothetical protein PHP59_12500 [Methanofollis sp.]|uniref:DUF7289 family protein n=1 Tax=Methanofollis sp. TaxID=2052835 RepID=UPI002632F14A|nr:hypothetical protein [Methanofollis sp.]MDD4256177.1 hypothetical protein [Methanofollis sp.]
MPLCARDDGLSEVVGFVLLLALIVVALSLYQVYGVPAAGREAEIAHMNQVKDRFVDYKIALDSLWLNNRNGVLLSTAFDLGTGSAATGGSAFSLPILTPAGSGGTVSVTGGGANLTVTALKGETEVPVIRDLSLGSLTYQSSNRYWVEQTWTYQGGAVFLSQEGGTTVRVAPSISARKTNNDNIDLTVAPISLDGSDTIAGSGPVRIETRMRWSESLSPERYDRVDLIIEADDPAMARAWKRAFDEVRRSAVGGEDDPLWISTDLSGNRATLSLEPGEDGKEVILTRHPASYEVRIHSAASLVE